MAIESPFARRLRISAFCLFALGCGSEAHSGEFETGPLMKPGDDCLRCHSHGSAYPQAQPWSLAGTVFPRPNAAADEGVPGVRLTVTDDEGNLVTSLTSNSVGNFYTPVTLPQPFRVALEYEGRSVEMPCPPPAGNCGACHSLPPIGGPLGRVSIAQGLPELEGSFNCVQWRREPGQ
ncbi:MAG TPA: carboxypeptidase-like regulatory domain-containing protein [Polyangiaceae bacterium]|nr:carboxypeptidase-like regulatory domain-containing protein [Polyangiaceae bacterium]